MIVNFIVLPFIMFTVLIVSISVNYAKKKLFFSFFLHYTLTNNTFLIKTFIPLLYYICYYIFFSDVLYCAGPEIESLKEMIDYWQSQIAETDHLLETNNLNRSDLALSSEELALKQEINLARRELEDNRRDAISTYYKTKSQDWEGATTTVTKRVADDTLNEGPSKK